jgi:hypothetical protein
MPGTKILSAFLIMVPATVLLTTEATLSEPAAEQCKASPGGSAPKGMHWYYRNNRATNKHCWYLGPAGVHVKSHVAAAAPSDQPAARKANLVDADNAASMQAMTADGAEPTAAPADAAPSAPVQAISAQPLQMQTASAQTALPQAPPAAQAATANQAAGGPGFGARWPEDLPRAEDLEQSEPPPVGNSYVEGRDAAATAQLPSKWPEAEAGRAAQSSAGETALRYFSILGILVIPLLLAAGWVARYSREPHRSNLRDRLWTLHDRLLAMADSLSQRLRRRRDTFEEAAFVGSAPPLSPAVSRRRAGPDWRERAPTDPAQDLKTSLAELMHDLRRAAEPGGDPARYVQRAYDRADERAFSPSLQPAE